MGGCVGVAEGIIDPLSSFLLRPIFSSQFVLPPPYIIGVCWLLEMNLRDLIQRSAAESTVAEFDPTLEPEDEDE